MSRDGFGLIEVMIAMLIFTMGALALAGSTTFVGAQLRAADLRTERQVARQQAIEELRAIPFDSVTARVEADAVTRGEFSIWWGVQEPRWALKQVMMVVSGPGIRDSRLQNVQDTVEYRIARPMK